MAKSQSDSYKKAGVDIEAGYKSVQLIKNSVAKTYSKNVLSDLGGFSGLYEMDLSETPNPVLVSGTDGVGTKLKLAFLLDKHDTIGIDCVAMCVNDIITVGAKPLTFLDYIAVGKNQPEKIKDIVEGVVEGCLQSGCSLVGGETAEMPGFYSEGEYDIAGYATGVVDKSKIINKETMIAGDILIAIPSTGVHSNGFSLVRSVFNLEEDAFKTYEGFDKPLGEILLEPTKIYVNDILRIRDKVKIRAISHVTGGGFYENVPRAMKDGLTAKINKADIKTPPIFDLIEKTGNIPSRDMYNTFNMGVGMVVIVAKEDSATTLSLIPGSYVLGEVIMGDEGIILC
ncbi:MAG: phosphoribosylformylglycinamidine cyclo-ligase [Spirochaetaceae bacterium]|nr:phosphoribosylformylglycinamidine cyclo-ligase [Spirochaetaceae bacterium]